MKTKVRVELRPSMFREKEHELAAAGKLRLSTFRYSTGVHALRVRNARGSIVLLPFQGQQVWDAAFDGHRLTMKTIFDEPRPTSEYLKTYGAFLIHCGATALGRPGPAESHPHHGELPNAAYEAAWLLFSPDEPSVQLCGRFVHRMAFGPSYDAEPSILLSEDSTLLAVAMRITNRSSKAMELKYMEHINFRPVDGARLLSTAPARRDTVTIKESVRDGAEVTAAYRAFRQRLIEEPSLHELLDPDQVYDPEIVMSIRYRADAEGWARSALLLPDGYAYCVRHRPAEFPLARRWIVRTPDCDAIGFALPATSENRERSARFLQAKETAEFNVVAGLLDPAASSEEKRRIDEVALRPHDALRDEA